MQQQVGWMESWKASQRKWHLSLELQESEWLTRGHSKQTRAHAKAPREEQASRLHEQEGGRKGCKGVNGSKGPWGRQGGQPGLEQPQPQRPCGGL